MGALPTVGRRTVLRAVMGTLVLAVVTGLVYPLAMTGIAQLLFRQQAQGSLVYAGDEVVGSSLIGQTWEGPRWFYGRPSALATPYDASTSSGSNQGPLAQALATAIEDRANAIIELEGPYRPALTTGEIPPDLLTASGSGLDPHISPEAALFQVPRIAEQRNLPQTRVEQLVRAHTTGPTLGFLGQGRVNVLDLNLALTGTGERQ